MGKLQDETSKSHFQNFNAILQSGNVDNALEIFNNILDRAAIDMKYTSGGKNHKKVNVNKMWWDKECELSRKNKFDLLKVFRKSNNEMSRRDYVKAKNCHKGLCKLKSHNFRQEQQHLLLTSLGDSSKFWSVIKRIRGGKLAPSSGKIKSSDLFEHFHNLLDFKVNSGDVKFDENIKKV